jgi:hypothetical protein
MTSIDAYRLRRAVGFNDRAKINLLMRECG